MVFVYCCAHVGSAHREDGDRLFRCSLSEVKATECTQTGWVVREQAQAGGQQSAETPDDVLRSPETNPAGTDSAFAGGSRRSEREHGVLFLKAMKLGGAAE